MRNNPNVRTAKIDKDLFIIKSNGVWYEVETRDLSGLEGHPDFHNKLIQATAGDDKDVFLYERCWRPFFAERLHNYRWEEIIRKTYSGQLKVAISKKPASIAILRALGVENDAYNQEPDYADINWERVAADQNKGDSELLKLFDLD